AGAKSASSTSPRRRASASGSALGSPIRSTRASTALVTSGSAGAPFGAESLSPLSAAGLWLAVIMIPAAAPRAGTACATTGVGTARRESRLLIPYAARVSATAAAKSSERKRVSYPTTTPRPASPDSTSCSAMAAVSRRTLAKVKSAAMRARQPDVPNLIGVSSVPTAPAHDQALVLLGQLDGAAAAPGLLDDVENRAVRIGDSSH